MPQIKKILFPVDFSDSCLATARYVQALAGRFEATIMLLHVVGMGEHTLADELLPVKRAQLDAFLADELKYFTVERVCVKGDPAPEIANAAKRWSADLVAMPTHGVGVFRRLLLGSVTAKVLHDLECPVWTSAHLETAPRLEEIHCRRILCAVDLTERSRNVLAWAAWLAGEYQASLGIVHATAALPAPYYGWNLAAEFKHSVTEQTARRIENLQKETGTERSRVYVDSGDPATVVAQTAREFDAELLVMGRHGGPGIYLPQNAYAILRESPCPVISI